MSHLEKIDFLGIPNEIIEKILSYLQSEDLLSLAVIGNKRLRDCSYKFLRKKPLGMYLYLTKY